MYTRYFLSSRSHKLSPTNAWYLFNYYVYYQHMIKKQQGHPVTYEHICDILIAIGVALIVFGSFMYWTAPGYKYGCNDGWVSYLVKGGGITEQDWVLDCVTSNGYKNVFTATSSAPLW